MPPLDLVDLQALPEPLVEVAQLVDPPGAEAQGLADGLGRPQGVLARSAVEGGELDAGEGPASFSASSATSAQPRSLRGTSRTPWTRFCSS